MTSIRPEGQPDVLLGGNSLVSFDSGMPEPMRRDLLDCLRYCDVRANEKHDRHEAWTRWINAYQGGLFKHGFALSGVLPHDIVTVSDATELRHAISATIQAASNEALSRLASQALERMLGSPHAQSFFNGWFTAGRSESMQVVPCGLQATEVVDVMICGLKMQTQTTDGSWFARATSSMTITIDGGAFRYSAQAYAPYREKIRQRLRDESLNYFNHLP